MIVLISSTIDNSASVIAHPERFGGLFRADQYPYRQ
jgi:hypothetical protein